MSLHSKLRAIRKVIGDANIIPYTHGLSGREIASFQNDANLNIAVDRAAEVSAQLMKQYPKLYVQSETALAPVLQKDFLQFYDPVVRLFRFLTLLPNSSLNKLICLLLLPGRYQQLT